jgi:hypothetical protein
MAVKEQTGPELHERKLGYKWKTNEANIGQNGSHPKVKMKLPIFK